MARPSSMTTGTPGGGSLGIIAAFSFYPGKNLGAFGDAGAVTTDDAQLEERVERLRDHGRISKYVYAEPGFCERLDTIQAAVLELRLKKLDAANLARRELADRYRAELDGVGDSRLPAFIPERPGVYHLFVVRTTPSCPVRAPARQWRSGGDPLSGSHHLTRWEHLGYRQGDFPVSEAWARECLSLPIYPASPKPSCPGWSRRSAGSSAVFAGPDACPAAVWLGSARSSLLTRGETARLPWGASDAAVNASNANSRSAAPRSTRCGSRAISTTVQASAAAVAIPATARSSACRRARRTACRMATTTKITYAINNGSPPTQSSQV